MVGDLRANDRVTKSDGGDVGGTWLCYKVDCLAFFLIFFLIFLIHPEPFYPFATYLSHLHHHRNRIPFIPTFHKLLPLFTPILLHISRYNLVTTKIQAVLAWPLMMSPFAWVNSHPHQFLVLSCAVRPASLLPLPCALTCAYCPGIVRHNDAITH